MSEYFDIVEKNIQSENTSPLFFFQRKWHREQHPRRKHFWTPLIEFANTEQKLTRRHPITLSSIYLWTSALASAPGPERRVAAATNNVGYLPPTLIRTTQLSRRESGATLIPVTISRDFKHPKPGVSTQPSDHHPQR